MSYVLVAFRLWLSFLNPKINDYVFLMSTYLWTLQDKTLNWIVTLYRVGLQLQYNYHLFDIDAFSGGAADWARAAAGVKHSYEVELRDHGVLGFILPANYVIPIGQEIWAAVKVVVFHVSQDNPPVYLAHNTSVLTVSPVRSSTPGSVPRSSTPGLETASRSFDHLVLNSAQMFYNSRPIVLIVGLLLIGRTVLCVD